MARFDSEYFAKMEQKEQAARKKTKKQVQQEEEIDALYSLELDRIRQEEEDREAAKRSRLAAEAERKRRAKRTAKIKRAAEDTDFPDEPGTAAALCNQRFGFSEVVGEAHDGFVHLIIERFTPTKYRVKRTSYHHFESLDECRRWAVNHGWTLTEYGCD